MTIDLLSQSAPPTATRAGRVALLKLAAEALRNGTAVPPAAAQFLGSALRAWLSEGGNLERDYLEVAAIPGSHMTVAALAAKLAAAAMIGDDQETPFSRGAQESPDADTVAP